MGAQQSELAESLARLPSLKNKPAELKAELTQFVTLCPLDTPLAVKMDTRVFNMMHALFAQEVALVAEDKGNPFDLAIILQALQRFMKVRSFYSQLAKADLAPFVNSLKTKDPLSLTHTHTHCTLTHYTLDTHADFIYMQSSDCT